MSEEEASEERKPRAKVRAAWRTAACTPLLHRIGAAEPLLPWPDAP